MPGSPQYPRNPQTGKISSKPLPRSTSSGGSGGSNIPDYGRAGAFGAIRKLLNRGGRNSLTVGASAVEAPTGETGPSLEDQIFDLQMQAIDARYGGDASGGSGYRPGLPPKQQSYSGPSPEQFYGLGRTGAGLISGSYGGLQNFISNAGQTTAQNINSMLANQQSAYSKAGQNIKAAIAPAQVAVSGTSAGAEAAADQQARLAATLQHYANINTQHQNLAVQQANEMQQGMNKIQQDYQAAKGVQEAEQRYRYVTGTNQKADVAKSEMARIAAINQEQMDRYNFQEAQKQESALGEASKGEGKAKAAKLELLAKFLGTQAKSGKNLTGVQGVLGYGKQQGNLDAAQKFLGMVAGARETASRSNEEAAADISGMKKKTTEKAELQKLLQGTMPDVKDKGALLDLFRTAPELSQLSKYVIRAPAQVYGNYDLMSQMMPDDMKKGGGSRADWEKARTKNSKLFKPGEWESKINKQINEKFSPFLDYYGLERDKADFQVYQNYLNKQQGLKDLYNSMFEIYSGKYGSGM